ncbi:hypothetical protein [Ruegeria lacuscaerulensis]|uniref:hypothetical protein n=1 Tax=Ruegeria lacuscaerulensis TaxID=55218 RepID=UPI0014816AA3|nr:hypothetical protein [Ruegeria lacuscaerulensis]
MRAGQNGRIAILWKQTELDGLEAAPLSFLNVGAAWSWRGHAAFVDGSLPHGREVALNVLHHFISEDELGNGAQGVVILTNGAQQFSALLYVSATQAEPLLVFEEGCPAREQDFWVDEFVEIRQAGGESASHANTVVSFPTRPRMDPNLHAVPRLPAANAGPLVD